MSNPVRRGLAIAALTALDLFFAICIALGVAANCGFGASAMFAAVAIMLPIGALLSSNPVLTAAAFGPILALAVTSAIVGYVCRRRPLRPWKIATLVLGALFVATNFIPHIGPGPSPGCSQDF